jgi:hypothetical protein
MLAVICWPPSTRPESSPSFEIFNEVSTRRCWQCVRRRLVCDLRRPSCLKCEKNGHICPGYASTKPLVWLPPGKVKSKVPRHGTAPEEDMASSGPPSIGPRQRHGRAHAIATAPPIRRQRAAQSLQRLVQSLDLSFQMRDIVADTVRSVQYCTWPPSIDHFV